MMTTKTILTAMALFGSLTLGSVATAGPGGGGGDMGGHFMRAMRNLELSEEQKTALREIREDSREDREALHAEFESLRETFRAELGKDSPDAAVLHGLVDRKAELTTERAHDRVDALIAAHAVLTPEQRAELLERMDEHHAEREARRGERGERDERGERGDWGPRRRGGR